MKQTQRIEKVYRDFGLSLRDLRQRERMSQETLASKVRLSRTSIVNIEAGRQRILLHDVPRFAKALDTDVLTLLVGVWL